MNCKVIREQLLQADRPERPGADLAAHLGQCPPCRQWHQRLVQLERLVPRLPVPPSHGKAVLLARLAGERVAPPRRPTARRSSRWQVFFQSPAMPPAVLAASLLVFAGLWSMQSNPYHRPAGGGGMTAPAPAPPRPPAPDLLVADLLQHNVSLARAETPKEQLDALAAMAERLYGATKTLAGQAETADLEKLTKLYDEVVRNGIVKRADVLRKLPPAERQEIISPIAERLAKAMDDAEDRAQKSPEETASPWRALASAARAGANELQTLLKGETKP
jgi:hypothetical protein